MFTAQLAAFLVSHHHMIGVIRHTFPGHTFDVAYAWATAHGFVFQK